MDRYWLLTNTCYGCWLPGDDRGFVGRVWEHRRDDDDEDARVTHHVPGTACDAHMPGLNAAAQRLMKGPPTRLDIAAAREAFAQFQETASHRAWLIEAVAIMHDHFHMVVGVREDPDPGKILGDFKSWASRRLNATVGRPSSGRWWTERGSKRKLLDDRARNAAIHYVLCKQPQPLLTWSPAQGLHYGRHPVS